MMKKTILYMIWIASIGIASPNAFAAKAIQYGVSGGMTYFSGARTQSLAPNNGYLGRFEAGMGYGYVRFTSSFSFVYASATSLFNDAGTENTYTFRMISGEFDFGLRCYFLNFLKKSPIQPYVGGGGAAHLTSLKFTESADMSATWLRTEARFFYGYTIFSGVDIFFTKKTGLNFHFEYSAISGTIGGTAFKLGGLRYLMGITKKLY